MDQALHENLTVFIKSQDNIKVLMKRKLPIPRRTMRENFVKNGFM